MYTAILGSISGLKRVDVVGIIFGHLTSVGLIVSLWAIFRLTNKDSLATVERCMEGNHGILRR